MKSYRVRTEMVLMIPIDQRGQYTIMDNISIITLIWCGLCWGSTDFKISFPAFFIVFSVQAEHISCREVQNEKLPVAGLVTTGLSPALSFLDDLQSSEMTGGDVGGVRCEVWGVRCESCLETLRHTAGVTATANPYKSQDGTSQYFPLETWLPCFPWGSHNDSRNRAIAILRRQFISPREFKLGSPHTTIGVKRALNKVFINQ